MALLYCQVCAKANQVARDEHRTAPPACTACGGAYLLPTPKPHRWGSWQASLTRADEEFLLIQGIDARKEIA